jgi:7-cyano-7-deazaguanosine (preQ0) biosynthesis protein QueE
MSAVLPLVELFGPTLQGEGPATGRAATFIRFGGCNLSCSWCDSAYTWDGERFDLREEIALTEPSVIAARVAQLAGHVPLVVLTGGEPLLNQRNAAWPQLLRSLVVEQGRILHVETNGTLVPTPDTLTWVSTLIVSPKLPHAGLHRGKQDPALARGWATIARDHDAHLKVVVRDVEDVDRALRLALDWAWPLDRVWVMPEGTTGEVLAERWPTIADAAAARGINASHRLHVLAWRDTRGH